MLSRDVKRFVMRELRAHGVKATRLRYHFMCWDDLVKSVASIEGVNVAFMDTILRSLWDNGDEYFSNTFISPALGFVFTYE